MNKIKKLHDSVNGDRLAFECPGCNTLHAVTSAWSFNGSYDKPTFSPSVKVTWNEWVEATQSLGPEKVCHSFITNGQIQFLTDCSHALAGVTVPLPNIDQD